MLTPAAPRSENCKTNSAKCFDNKANFQRTNISPRMKFCISKKGTVYAHVGRFSFLVGEGIMVPVHVSLEMGQKISCVTVFSRESLTFWRLELSKIHVHVSW